jgi:type IV pilus assembly protein PilW
MAARRCHRRQQGFSLIDVMVGIVVALIAVLVIYQVFDVAEGIKRNATGAGDAQQNGLLSTFMMALQAADSGANIAVVADELDACPKGDGSSQSDVKATLRPFPIIITDSGDDAASDSFVVNYGSAERVVTSVNFRSAPTIALGGDGDTFDVQSPLGFQKDDIIVTMSPDANGTGQCAQSIVKDVSAVDADGYVTITHGAQAVAPSGTTSVSGSSSLLNLGPTPRRIQYSVDGNGTLQSLELFNVADGTTSVPIANNVVLMKIQYGIADPATGFLQKWVKAGNDGSEDWSANQMLQKTYTDLSRIKAVRIGLVVRSESYDKCAYADTCPNPTSNTFSYTLFSQCDGITCPDPITGSLDPTPGKGNFRDRVYETVIPLRNAVWNLHKAA